MEIILASQSPRRGELLAKICPHFRVCPAQVDETLQRGVTIEQEIQRLAHAKAEAVLHMQTAPACVIGADTMVVVDGMPLGKPQNTEHAHQMLGMLSGRAHEVLTAVSVQTTDGFAKTALSATTVWFAPMTDAEIEAYIQTGEPMDKAGAYGIQGMGAKWIHRIEGDYYSVMGLPVSLLYQMLGQAKALEGGR